MYTPYLKGKQFEFLALRDLAEFFSPEEKEKVLPIVEPVKKSTRDASTAFQKMIGARWKFALVLNPRLGDFQRGDNDYYSLVSAELEPNRDAWVPAFILDKKSDVKSMIEAGDFKNVMLILPKDEDVDSWAELISSDVVKYVVICDGDSMPTVRKVRRLGDKELIRMDDSFKAQQKNADYAGDIDHRFTDRHSYYTDFGFAGFGDYTTLPSAFIEGGVSPSVVAIHLTYNKNSDEVWIHHFLSDPKVKGNENVQGKFFEAAVQVEPFFNERPADKTPAIDELVKQVKANHYPGLGQIKKYSMKHHIILMSKF